MITIDPFGSIKNIPVWCATLTNGPMRAQVLSIGAITKSIQLANHDLILGYQSCAAYEHDAFYMGAIVGRVANRIANSAFTLNGLDYKLDANESPNQLHGGAAGLHTQHWAMEINGNTLELRYCSPNGAGGFPGSVEFMVSVTLTETGITYQMTGIPDVATPINMAQHNYYNLGGSAHDHQLYINASHYTPVSKSLIPTGGVRPVEPHMDFSNLREMNLDLDHNYVLKSDDVSTRLVGTKAALTLQTDQVGLQVYAGAGLSAPFEPNHGICLEPQYFPNSVNQKNFPPCIHTPENPYSQTTTLNFNIL